MNTVIYYYTGTGNSLWTARLLAAELGAELRSMVQTVDPSHFPQADRIGLVFPVHMWGIPNLVLEFIGRMPKDRSAYYFAAAVNAGQVSRTLIQLRDLLNERGLTLSSGIDLVLPSNYIPWGGPGPVKIQQDRFAAVKEKVKARASGIASGKAEVIDRGPLWQRIIFTALYKMTFNMIRKMDRDFWSDEKCNACAVCEKVCPSGNIVMKSGKPEWQHKCEQCLSCIQWCPRQSIQYGKKTPAFERYHHPEVKLADIIAAVK